jgi:excisionase family DNA binding protein
MPPDPAAGKTTSEFAKRLRVGNDTVRGWIKSGRLGAVNTAPPGQRPRYVILPEHSEAFEQSLVVQPPKPRPARRKKTPVVDFFPD